MSAAGIYASWDGPRFKDTPISSNPLTLQRLMTHLFGFSQTL